jgi:hypothetical protein
MGPGRGSSAEDVFDGRLSVWLCDVIQCSLGGTETGIRAHGQMTTSLMYVP